MNIIQDRRCEICKYSFKENNTLTCRKNPPDAHPIMQMTQKGPIVVGVTGVWPSVSNNAFCHEFVKGIIV